jgi:branched-chain amino acid transport system permease protein
VYKTEAVAALGLNLRGLPVRTLGSELPQLGLVIAGLCVLLAINAGDAFTLNILATTLLFAGLATSWNIIGGFGGQFSLCHGVFFALGAYLAANLFDKFQVLPWLTLFPAMLLGAVTAVVISWPAFRLRGPFFAIATMAFNEVVFVLANTLDPLTGGPRGLTVPFRIGLQNMIFRSRMPYALLMLGFLVVCLVISLLVLRSRLGYYLQAVRDNEEAARASGIDVLRTKLTGMAISAALTGAGGVLFAMQVRIIDPPSLLSLSDIGVKFALIALIGGIGRVYGPLYGALLVVPLESQLRAALGAYAPGSHLIAVGAVLILSALFFRRGLVGAGESLWARIRAWRGAQ